MRSLMALFVRPKAHARTPFRDPAPSRWSYRIQRLMLTPSFITGIRIGVPLLLIAVILGTFFAQEDNRVAVASWVEDTKDRFQHRPEFMVDEIEIVGANISVAAAINAITNPIELPISSFDLDLPGLRGAVTDLTAVQDAIVRVLPDGRLEIAVTERRPVAVWRHVDGLRLIDRDGVLISMIQERSDRSDLPLIAGDGAMDALPEAMALFAAASPVSERVRGLVRMGERRWDMVLDRDQRVLLPDVGAVAAMDRLLALNATQRILDRDVSVIDMRNPDRLTVRLTSTGIVAVQPVAAPADIDQ